jgi:hypothetical protein
LKPLFIGSAGNLGLGGPPPLIAQPPPADTQPAPPPPAAPNSNSGVPSVLPGPGGVLVAPPPGSSPVPGTVVLPQATPPTSTPAPDQQPAPATPPTSAPAPSPDQAPPRAAPQSAAADQPITSPGVGSAQVIISPPASTFRVAGGPYLVPLSIVDAARVSTMTLTLVYDPTKLRVRSVQEGSFMRTGGATVVFNQQTNGNRVDITLARGADSTGASGTGLLAAVLFDAIAPGSAPLTLSGTATGPGGEAMGLQFRPITVTVQ